MARNKNDGGWIKLHRRLFESEMWTSEPFTKAQAWVDLIFMANFEDRKILIGNRFVTIERGQIWTNTRELANRWKWSKNRVQAYITMLQEDAKVVTEGSTKGTLLTIVNYAFYQGGRDTKGATESPEKGHEKATERPQPGLSSIYIKNDKKGRREEEKDVANCTENGDNSAPSLPPASSKHKQDLPEWLARTVSTLPKADRHEGAASSSEGGGRADRTGADGGSRRMMATPEQIEELKRKGALPR